MAEERAPRGRLVLQAVTVAVLTVIAVVPVVGNQLRVADVDPQFMRDLIERMHRFGGTFYQNGIYNKGALEPVVYDVARHLGGYNGMWVMISAFAAVAALVSAVVAGRIARWVGAPKALAMAVGIALYVHLTVSPSNYAGVLYARNMTTALLAVAFFLTFEDRCWRSKRARLVTAIGLGVALGVVTQSLFTEALAGAAIGIPALVLLAHRAVPEERIKLAGATVGSALAIVVGVPIWYVLRGSFTAYWASWFQDARLQSIGTQRSLGSQLALGRHQIYIYYQHRPLALFVIVAFVVLTYAMWPGA
ncbi:MAG TPA: hypothetical protein VNY84_00560, partial [Acidimicrobiales bacterium]|nr:hypothetical protein [Acidimicrobiales bacterium]